MLLNIKYSKPWLMKWVAIEVSVHKELTRVPREMDYTMSLPFTTKIFFIKLKYLFYSKLFKLSIHPQASKVISIIEINKANLAIFFLIASINCLDFFINYTEDYIKNHWFFLLGSLFFTVIFFLNIIKIKTLTE